MLSRKTIIALLAAVLCGWLGAHSLSGHARDMRAEWPVGEEHVWLPPPQAAPIFAIGYRQLWADIQWARVLVYYGTNRRETKSFQYQYLTRYLDNILALDEKFERVYEWASYAVTYQGGYAKPEEFRLSIEYLERAMEVFPNSYRYFWAAGLRYYIDLPSDSPEDKQRLREHGAALIEQAMRKPDAPNNLAKLAAGLRTRLGQHERALANLREVILTTEDPEAQAELIETYRQLAGKSFPDEMTAAKAAFERGWSQELSFAPPPMYALLGDRPPAAIDLDSLVTDLARFTLTEAPLDQAPTEHNPADADPDAPSPSTADSDTTTITPEGAAPTPASPADAR